MSSKDFIVIAEIIKAFPRPARHVLTEIFATKLGRAYPNFNPDTFRDYIWELSNV